MTNSGSTNTADGLKDVRERLLDAADQLFAGNGYDGTSIRHITAKAGCNLAAVNYHFGGKNGLYRELFRRHFEQMRRTWFAGIEKVMSGPAEPKLEDLLRAFSKAFLEPFADSKRFMQLFNREMAECRLPKDIFVAQLTTLVRGTLRDALRKICPYIEDRQAEFAIHFIMAQLRHIIEMEIMFEGDDAVLGFDSAEAIEHIVNFSAAGIRAYRKKTTPEV